MIRASLRRAARSGSRPSRCAPGGEPPRPSRTAPPCCGDPLRRRGGDGGRPSGDRGQPHRPPAHGEGLPGRPLRGSPSPARPARPSRWCSSSSSSSSTTRRSRAGRSASRARPTSSRHGPQQPAGGHAGARRRADLRGLRPRRGAVGCSSTTSPAGATRRPTTSSSGSGSMHAGTVVKLGVQDGPHPRRGDRPRRRGAVRRGRRGLAPPAAPTSCAASSRSSRRSRRRDVERRRRTTSCDACRGDRRQRRGRLHEHALLRRARAGDEGPGRLRPQGHRPRPAPSSSSSTTTASSSSPRTRRPRCTRSARSTTASPSPASASTTSSTSSASPACATPTSRATQYSREDVDGQSLANAYAQMLGQIFTHEMKPIEVEILVAEVGATARPGPGFYNPLRRHVDGRGRATASIGGDAEAIGDAVRGGLDQPGLDRDGAAQLGAVPSPARARRLDRDPRRRPTLEVAVLARRQRTAFERLRRAEDADSGLMLTTGASGPIGQRAWSDGSSASRTSTGSPARSAASVGSAPTRSPATCSAGGVVGHGAATSSSRTAPASTSTSAATPSTPPPSATRSSTSSIHDKAGERILEQLLGSRGAAPPGGGHPRRHLPLQEQHRLGRQQLRLPRELPRRPRRRLRPLRRGAHPVPRHPPDLRRRRQGPADRPGRHVLHRPAGRAHLGGRRRRPPPGAARSSTPATSPTPTPSATAAST